MTELSRAEVVELALEANFGKHEVMKDVAKFERLIRLVVRALKEKEDEFDMDGRC
jgi:hypothetical protein